jgi:hypothetical protein
MVSYSRYKKYKNQAHSLKNTLNQYKNPLSNIAHNHAVEMGAAERREGFGKGVEQAEEFMGRNFQGLNPTQRRLAEERGRQGINREVQGMQRQLVANQGRRGIRGGAAYAQQADLARMGTQSQQELQRDIEQQNQDMALKRMAATYAMGQGEVAQRQTDRQLALEQAELAQEKKRQRKLQGQYSKLFSRV